MAAVGDAELGLNPMVFVVVAAAAAALFPGGFHFVVRQQQHLYQQFVQHLALDGHYALTASAIRAPI